MSADHIADWSAVLERLRSLRRKLQKAWSNAPGYLIKRHTWYVSWFDRLRTRTSGLDFDIVMPAQKRRLFSLRRAEATMLQKQFQDILEREERAERQNRKREKAAKQFNEKD